MDSQLNFDAFHGEITEWKSMVNLVRDELKIFNDELSKIAKKNLSMDALRHVEHFQNQFIRQNEVSDEFFHDLKQADKAIMRQLETSEKNADVKLGDEHFELRDRANIYERIFKDLKNEYHSFLEKAV
ncbi:hypothetical protein [Solitalea koreensis]|uniref:Uncharacterized protein n=1 Tax=Solitalea koreensis TaxID=543615 RepID=A0A521DB37_9SPHI|nr:hypothetical protein [Solitalea koreensis]SMO68855.1 hypothetical protein SAMN06265350_106147 [Solitalea koreensis]